MTTYAGRRRRAVQALAELSLDTLVVASPPNVRYLTGFTGEGFLLLSEDPLLVTDRRYEIEAHEQAGDCRVIAAERGAFSSLLEGLSSAPPPRPGFESEALTYSQFEKLRDSLSGGEFTATSQVVEKLRMRKEPGEIALMAQAAALVDRVLDSFLPALEPGPSEKEIGLELMRSIISAGAENVSFTPIVAAGPDSALPHATLTDRALHPGDIVLLDLGAKLEGYCSDITRTLVLGEPPADFCERYHLVLEAQRAGVEAARAGRPVAEVDQAARQVFADAGMGERFSHSLGHGVGLEVHEGPALSSRSEQMLEVGHVFTIEPGVYFEGWGGIRHEDQFALEETGLRRLTSAPKFAC